MQQGNLKNAYNSNYIFVVEFRMRIFLDLFFFKKNVERNSLLFPFEARITFRVFKIIWPGTLDAEEKVTEKRKEEKKKVPDKVRQFDLISRPAEHTVSYTF